MLPAPVFDSLDTKPIRGETMLRLTGLVAAATLAAGAVAALGHGASAGETLYYGRTSQGLGVYIPVRGTRIPSDMRAYVLSWIYKHTPGATSEFHPGIFGSSATTFHGGRLTYHHLEKLSGGTIEAWFEATLKGKLMTGIYRERAVGFSPVPRDTGTLRFTAYAYASQAGREWAGTTADGKPLRMTVRYRLVPGHVVINGKREQEAKYTISVPATTRLLACQNADGTTTSVNASLPALSAELSGSEDLANSFSKSGGLHTLLPAAGTATANGATIKAELSVKRLAWQGAGLAATGTLTYQGSLAGETGTATCARTTTAFTLRLR
jgi:hypothetical protein